MTHKKYRILHALLFLIYFFGTFGLVIWSIQNFAIAMAVDSVTVLTRYNEYIPELNWYGTWHFIKGCLIMLGANFLLLFYRAFKYALEKAFDGDYVEDDATRDARKDYNNDLAHGRD